MKYFQMNALVLSLALTVSIALAAQAQPVSVSVYTIRDNRVSNLGDSQSPSVQHDAGLTIELLLRGFPIESATHWGHVTLAAKDEHGKSLAYKPGFYDEDTQYVQLNREQMWFFRNDAPRNEISVEVKLDPPSRTARTIKLKGELKIKNSQTTDVVVNDLAGMTGKDIDSPILKSAGASIRVMKHNPQDSSAYLQLQITDPHKTIIETNLINANGEKVNVGRSWFGMGHITTLTLSSFEPIPPNARLNISVETEKTETTVPIMLKDVPLP